jgi:hypothetical protein
MSSSSGDARACGIRSGCASKPGEIDPQRAREQELDLATCVAERELLCGAQRLGIGAEHLLCVSCSFGRAHTSSASAASCSV